MERLLPVVAWSIFRNLRTPESVLVEQNGWEASMSLFDKLLGRTAEPRKRVRICVECGMPVEEHKDWCAILQGQKELAERGVNVVRGESQA